MADRNDDLATLLPIVRGVEPGLDADTVLGVLDRLLGTAPMRRRLVHALTENPGLLTCGRPDGRTVVDRLIHELLAVGASTVVAPRCPGCDRPKALSLKAGGTRMCRPCAQNHRHGEAQCAGCGNNTRSLTHRNRAGELVCGVCAPPLIDDPAGQVCATLTRHGVGVGNHQLRSVVEKVSRQPYALMQLAWELEDHPRRLTGDGADGSPILMRLLTILAEEGDRSIVVPPCPGCGRLIRLGYGLDGKRVCRRCYLAAGPALVCVECGKTDRFGGRTVTGEPVCSPCWKQRPEVHERCIMCGNTRYPAARTLDGPVCKPCYRLPTACCTICGRQRPCRNIADGTPRCLPCSTVRRRCIGCGQMRIISAVTPAGDQCKRCFIKNPLSFKACSRCGVVEHLRLHGLCTGCVAADQVDALLGGFDPLGRADLQRLRAALIAAKPDSLLQWLSLSEGATVLAEIATGTCPATHDSIERRLPGKDGDHLRGLLVTAGMLEPRDEHLIRLASWLDNTLAAVENTHHRQIVRAYATWAEIGPLRRRLAGSTASSTQTTNIRRKVSSALALLSWLDDENIPLAGCRQIDIDGYLAGGNSERYLSGRFLQWAVRQGHAHAVEIPSWTTQTQTRPLGSELRWALAERLLSDSSLEALDRIAGLLNLLYAQPFTVITRLTVAHIEVRNTGTYVLLGESPLLMPDRLATLIGDHLSSRGSYAVVGRHSDSPWLFPGTHPDRHISATHLGHRLRRIGVYSAPSRRAALLDLATQVPAAVIARTLGISARVASSWTSDGGWAAYAAEVQRRPSTPPEPR